MPTLLIGGIVSPILSLKAIQPSMTEISSLRHSSTVFPDAQTPSSSGTSPNMGSGSSMTLYSALSRAAMIYSANIIKANLERLGEISCAVHQDGFCSGGCFLRLSQLFFGTGQCHIHFFAIVHSRLWLYHDSASARPRARARMRERASRRDIGQRALAGDDCFSYVNLIKRSPSS